MTLIMLFRNRMCLLAQHTDSCSPIAHLTTTRSSQFIQYRGTIKLVKASDNSQAVTLPSVRIKMSDMSYCDWPQCVGHLQERVSFDLQEGRISLSMPQAATLPYHT